MRGPARERLAAGAAVLLLTLSGSAGGDAALDGLPRGRVFVLAPDGTARARFDVWLGLTEASQNRGLMEVRGLAPSKGMLFLYNAAQPRQFWMRNTRIPLDIIFARGERIVRVHRGVPPCPDSVRNCPVYASGEPSDTILEIAGGSAEKLGVREGDRIRWGSVNR
ncbi:MAG: hypothetical protein A2V83_03375 [Nitrospirae bacterium RBG_16_64_22]|nr:MAG: hypothetical protein A2V83_03375 [Nitrospirae bacterium RBG_16_64_22]